MKTLSIPLLRESDFWEPWEYELLCDSNKVQQPFINAKCRMRDGRPLTGSFQFIYRGYDQDPSQMTPALFELFTTQFSLHIPGPTTLRHGRVDLPGEFDAQQYLNETLIAERPGRFARCKLVGMPWGWSARPTAWLWSGLHRFSPSICKAAEAIGEKELTDSRLFEFTLWIYRVTSLARDLVDYPLKDDPLPGSRRKLIVALRKGGWGEHLEGYLSEEWRSILAERRFSPIRAHRARLMDARLLYYAVKAQCTGTEGLDRFVTDGIDALIDHLVHEGLAKRCRECQAPLPHDHRDDFCTDPRPGKATSCSKLKYNRLYYATQSKENKAARVAAARNERNKPAIKPKSNVSPKPLQVHDLKAHKKS